MTAPN